MMQMFLPHSIDDTYDASGIQSRFPDLDLRLKAPNWPPEDPTTMQRPHTAAVIALCATVAACDNMAVFAPPDAGKWAKDLTGGPQAAGAGNPQCKMFDAAEVARLTGVPVGPAANAAHGAGCQWRARGEGARGKGFVMVVVLPADYHWPPSSLPGFHKLAGRASGFVTPFGDGWYAGAIKGRYSVTIWINRAGSTEGGAIALLDAAMNRPLH